MDGQARRSPASTPVPDTRAAYRERGSGLPIVFLHGGTGTGEHDWGGIAGRLAARHRTVVVDLRGHGASPDPTRTIGIARFGLDLTHVLRSLGLGRAVLVGFSAGGNTLLHLLAARPPLGARPRHGRGVGRGRRLPRRRDHDRKVAERATEPPPAPRPPATTATGPICGRGSPTTGPSNLALDGDALARIACPALVCHGDGDVFQPVAYAERLAAGLPQGELALIAGAGHAAQLDEPDAFLALLEPFLARLT